MVDFGDAFSSEKAFLKTAQTFEDLGVSAYNGAAPNIKSKEVLGSAGSIVQVEARHAAAIRALNGQPITEAAFDKALKQPQVLQAVKPYVKSYALHDCPGMAGQPATAGQSLLLVAGVDGDQVFAAADQQQSRRSACEHFELAAAGRSAQRYELAHDRVDVWSATLRALGIHERQPRRAGGEAARRRRVPLHRVAVAVAAVAVVAAGRPGPSPMPDLVALVEEGAAPAT